MTGVLILRLIPGVADTLERDLNKAGAHVLGATTCEQLVQDTILWKPDVVVVREAAASPALFAATSLLEQAFPVAVAVFTDDIRVESMEQALASGIHAWVVRGYGAARVRAVLQLARVRFARDKLQREALAGLSARLEERKLVDRAKGILMSAGAMAEDDAFGLLRTAAMQDKQRLGQVAQRLIAAAGNAEAMNRAGQLRMLSQRLVKLELLTALGVEPHCAAALRVASIERLHQNFGVLAELLSVATFGDLLEACQQGWQDLAASLEAPGREPAVKVIDVHAEKLLESAERLTAALESASAVAGISVVNVAGRQRMLAQRYAKIALQLGSGPAPAGAALAAQLDDCAASFEAAMIALGKSPLTGAPGRACLAAAGQSWQALRTARAAVQDHAGRLAIARSSEELIEHFDRLTLLYEHSLHVLMG